MSRLLRVQRYTNRRRCVLLECLEPRWLLSGQQLVSDVAPANTSSPAPYSPAQDVITTFPANEDELIHSPDFLVVTFTETSNQQIMGLWNDGDVMLYPVDDHGIISTTPVPGFDDPNNPPP